MEQANEGVPGESSRRRIKLLPEQWRALIEAQPSSGLGAEEYCRQHQITPSCFYRWRRFLAQDTGAASPWAGQKRRRRPANSVGPVSAIEGFAAVHLERDPKEPRSPQGDSIRLMLAGGRELVLPASMPTPRLVELLLALEGMPRPAATEGDV